MHLCVTLVHCPAHDRSQFVLDPKPVLHSSSVNSWCPPEVVSFLFCFESPGFSSIMIRIVIFFFVLILLASTDLTYFVAERHQLAKKKMLLVIF